MDGEARASPTRYSLLATRYSLLAIRYSLFAIRHSPESVQPELAVHGADFGRPDQARMRHRHREERALQLLQPERQKAVECRKSRAEIVILPDIGLQQGGMIGKPVEDLRRRQTVAVELASKVAGCNVLECHDRCPPIRTSSVLAQLPLRQAQRLK